MLRGALVIPASEDDPIAFPLNKGKQTPCLHLHLWSAPHHFAGHVPLSPDTASIVGSMAQEQGGFLSPALDYSVSENSSLRGFEQAGGRDSK